MEGADLGSVRKLREKFKDLDLQGKSQHIEKVSETKNRGHRIPAQERNDLVGNKTTGRLGESGGKDGRQGHLGRS